MNLLWEQTRYLSTMIYNVNCTKRSQMMKPSNLFPLPQDKMLKTGVVKSTPEQFKAFLEKARSKGVDI